MPTNPSQSEVRPWTNVQVHSVTTASTGATSTGTTSRGWGGYSELDVLTDISLAGGAVATLYTYVDTQLGGTVWINVARSPIMTAAAPYVIHLSRNLANAAVSGSADAGAGTVRAIGFGEAIRIRTLVEGTATTSMSATIYVNGVA